MDPGVARALEQVEALRQERNRVKRELTELLDRTLELGGVGGLWAKLRGSYDTELAEAEQQVQELKAVLEIAEAAVQDGEARLAAARSEVPERPAAEVPVARASEPGPPQDLASRLQAIEQLEAVLKPMPALGRRILERARSSSRHNRLSASRRSAENLLGQLVDQARVVHHDHVLGEVRGEWEDHLAEAMALAELLDVPLQLPSVGGRLARDELVGIGIRSSSRRMVAEFTGLDTFADAVEQVLPEIDALLDQLRESHRELRRGSDAPVEGRSASVDELVRRWERLLEVGRQLDRACVPGVRTSALLGPIAAWNREAAAAAELAEELGLPLRPPVNQGGDLVRFVDELRALLPTFEQRVQALVGVAAGRIR